jgi:hypothetical protein
LQRRELMTAAYGAANLPRDVGAMSDKAFMADIRKNANTLHHIPAKVASEEDYYRALLESRGVDVAQIIRLATGKAKYRLGLWLKAAWNVIKGKRGTPYLVEKDTMPAPEPIAARPWDERHAGEVHKQTGNIIAVEKAAPKRRGRPPGSKNRPKPVYSPGQQAAA